MKLKFIGATNDVTGSKTLIEAEDGKILIDSGLYQGVEETVRKNLEILPFDTKEIKAIILTHAHLDHSGFIPRLVKRGFRGTIYCTKPTVKLARIILADSAEILEKKENHFMSEFYETEHVAIAYGLFQAKKFNETFSVHGLEITFLPAGHILGAASVSVSDGLKTWVFSGDLGRSNDPLMPAPEACPPADLVVMEATYGDRERKSNIHDELALFLKKVKAENKIAIVASFAVARAQMLITLIHEFYKLHPEEKVRVVIDGPMMSEANKVYTEYANELNNPQEVKYALGNVENILHVREFESLQKFQGPLIVISSSGMVTGGRIWRYLATWQDEENTLLYLPGFQAEGTPGRALSEGKRDIHDEEGLKIRWSGEVWTSSAFSSHADQNELLNWTKNLKKETHIYLNHGDYKSKLALQKILIDRGFKNCEIAIPE